MQQDFRNFFLSQSQPKINIFIFVSTCNRADDLALYFYHLLLLRLFFVEVRIDFLVLLVC